MLLYVSERFFVQNKCPFSKMSFFKNVLFQKCLFSKMSEKVLKLLRKFSTNSLTIKCFLLIIFKIVMINNVTVNK